MSPAAGSLTVVMYHYVRDPGVNDLPITGGLPLDRFRQQVTFLRQNYEVATLESALAFWQGHYTPLKAMCLLTFDDGLKDHYANVVPLLVDEGVQGVFFLATSCLEQQRVLSVHKNHLLMGMLGFDAYRAAFLQRVSEFGPDVCPPADVEVARKTYRWDTPDVASFKYLLNFVLGKDLRDGVISELFEAYFADESGVARQLYLTWECARQMQRAGMLMGGHSHEHVPLATLAPEQQRQDIATCGEILRRRLNNQASWPFSYPFGKADTFDGQTVQALRSTDFTCAFSTVAGSTRPADDVYALARTDTNSVQMRRDGNEA